MKKVIAALNLSKIFGLAAFVLGASLFTAGSVQAQEVTGRMCAISGYLSFQGPLTAEDGAHEVYGEATISACTDENGPVEGAEAVVSFTGSGIANCALQSFSLTQFVQWTYGGLDFITLQPAIGDRAPLGAYKGSVNFGESAGYKVIMTALSKEPLQTLSCLLGVEPMGTYNFSGVQIFADAESSASL